MHSPVTFMYFFNRPGIFSVKYVILYRHPETAAANAEIDRSAQIWRIKYVPKTQQEKSADNPVLPFSRYFRSTFARNLDHCLYDPVFQTV